MTALDVRARATALRLLTKYGTSGFYTQPPAAVYSPYSGRNVPGEKLVNGEFGVDLTGWTSVVQVSVVNGAARFVTTNTQDAVLNQALTGLDTTKDHTIEFTLANPVGITAFLARMGNTPGATQSYTSGIVSATGTVSSTFKPATANQFLQLLQTTDTASSIDLLSISLRELEVAVPVKVLITTPSKSDLRAGVLETEKTCLIAGSGLSVYPKPADKLLVDGVTYTVRPVQPIYSGDQVALWMLGVKST